jgi:flagella basal body P-ring formation protein FlgA
MASAGHSPCIVVEGDEIRAGDMAKVWTAFRRLPQDQPVAPAPAPTLRRLFTGPELGVLARKLRLDVEGSAAKAAPAKTCFERHMESLTRDALLEALTSALERDGFERGAIQLELIDYTREPVPSGSLEVQPQGLSRPPVAAPSTPVTWRGRVRFGNARSFPVWTRVRLLAKQPRLVARSTIPAGRSIKAEDVEIAMLDVFPYPRTADAPSLDLVSGRMSRRAIRTGEPVVPSMLGTARDVERGDVVTVEVQSGTAMLRFDAKAESGGRKGDMIMVRNPSNGRRFQGRVGERGTVTVDVAAALTISEGDIHAEKR